MTPRSRPRDNGAAAWVRMAWLALLAATPILLLLPDGAEGQLRLAGWLPGYAAGVAERGYGMIKAAMPWLVVGTLLPLVWPRTRVQLWAVGLVPLIALTAWLGLELEGDWLRRLLFVLPGLALGLWLGERTLAAAVPAPAAPARPRPIADVAPPQGAKVAATQASHARHRPSRSGAAMTGTWPRRLAGATILLAVAALLPDFPRWPWLLGLGLAGYALLLGLRPRAWLVVLPAALPLLDWAPWSGRFFWDEFDLLMLVTAAMALLGPRPAVVPPMARLTPPLLGLLLLATVVSGLAGLGSPPPLDANALSSYWSPYNSLRVAKGLLWGGLIFLWLRGAGLDARALGRPLALGMGLGLLGVGLIGVWEHWLFAGFDTDHTYRIVATFSSMHTGGGHIEAWLVAAMPFLWLGMFRPRHLLLTAPLAALGAYVMLFTVARGGVLALAVALAILALGSGRLYARSREKGYLLPLGLIALVAAVVLAGISGGYFQQRLAQAGQDWQIRVDHWDQALGLRDDGAFTRLFGMGLGSFPRTFLQRGPAAQQPATYGFGVAGGNTFLRLGSGETLYYTQRVPLAGDSRYRLELDARAPAGEARLDTPVCEKQLLNSRECVWFGFAVPGDGQWHHLTHEFASGKLAAGAAWEHPPVELVLHHPDKQGLVEVDDIRLLGPDGEDLLCNGDFSAGGDCWFFKTHSHLPWHIKNLWVHVLFEQGWVGLLLFAGLSFLALGRLARAGWGGQPLAWAWLAALAGLLTVGLFDSLLDAPRLATLLVAGLLLGAGHEWAPGVPRGRSRRRRHAKGVSGHRPGSAEEQPAQGQ